MSCAELCQTGFLTLCGDSEPCGMWNNYPRNSWPQQNRLEKIDSWRLGERIPE